MNSIIKTRIYTRLSTDATLLGLLGIKTLDTERVPFFDRQTLMPHIIPSITMTTTSTPKTLFPGVDAAGQVSGAILATVTEIPQFDIWVSADGGVSGDGLPLPSTAEDTEAIESRMDILLLLNSVNFIQDTRAWSGVSSTQAMYEPDTRLWHKSIRYSFQHFIMSGYGLV